MTVEQEAMAANFIRIAQTAALGLISVFLVRFIGSVDSLTETVNLLKIEVKEGKAQSIEKLIYIEKTVNKNDDRITEQEIRVNQLEREIFILKQKRK